MGAELRCQSGQSVVGRGDSAGAASSSGLDFCPPTRQDLIFVVENVAPAHHECHMAHGATMECRRRCLEYAVHHLDAQRVGEWYVSLWRDQGLPMRRGTLEDPPDWEAYLDRVAGAAF